MRWIIRTFGFKSHLTSQEKVLSVRNWQAWESESICFCSYLVLSLCWSPYVRYLIKVPPSNICFLIFYMTVDYSPQWPLVSVSNKRQTCMRSDYVETNSWNNKAMSWHKYSPYQSCDLFGQRHIPRTLAGADRSTKSLKYGLWLSRPCSPRKRSGDWKGQPA